MNHIEIRPIKGVPDMAPVEEIQQQAWGRGDDLIIPKHFLHALQFNGSVILGAYDGNKIVGYSLGVLGAVPDLDLGRESLVATRLQLYSHQLAVLPDYQGKGVGVQLKIAQMEAAEKLGLRRISWTFDPLVTRNAWVNIGRLGGIASTYLVNFYGGFEGEIPSDRLYLEWWIAGPRVKARVQTQRKPLGYEAVIGAGATLANGAGRNAEGWLTPAGSLADTDDSYTVLVEVPTNHKEISAASYELGMAWRTHIRQLLQTMFREGFAITDFVRRTDEGGQLRCYYLLTHRDAAQGFEMM